MRFKKWRNRPGCEGAFRLFLLNNRGRVRGAWCVVRGAGCGASVFCPQSPQSPLRAPRLPCPTAASRARTLLGRVAPWVGGAR